jgi:gamma-glutamyltranspeptidase/glutathione hydrolase
MRMVMSRFPTARRQRRGARRFRQITVSFIVAAASAWLSACGSSEPPLGVIGHVEGDFGGVVSDEPTASLIAGEVLSAGGLAADAAVALYFTLSVTYPSAAGLGGGGVCIIHDNFSGKVETLDFTAGRPARAAPDGRPEFAVPGGVRGMAALHARYGRLRWSQVVQPAERLARFGHPISRAFARELRRHAAIVKASSGLAALFKGATGPVLEEGEDLRQLELAAFLGRVRAKGAGESYTGVLARRLAASYQAAGGTVTIEDLRNYRPVWRKTVKGSFGNHDVHFAPPPVLGGDLAARLWDALEEKGAYERAPEGARDTVVVGATASAYAALGGGGGGDGDTIPDYSTTSFAVMDQFGGAVACSVTMNAPFGVARLAPGTGVIAGAAPTPGRDGRASLAPMLIVNDSTTNTFFAAGASGDASGPTSMISVALKLLLDERKLADAIGAARFHAGRAGLGSRAVFAEAAADAAATARFEAAGYRVVEVPSLARVNAIWCPKGIPLKPELCVYVTDGRGSGYAVSAER